MSSVGLKDVETLSACSVPETAVSFAGTSFYQSE